MRFRRYFHIYQNAFFTTESNENITMLSVNNIKNET